MTALRLLLACSNIALIVAAEAAGAHGAPGGFTGLQAGAVSPFAAVVSWSDPAPGRAAVSYGLAHGSDALWATAAKVGNHHTLRVGGLAPGSAYELHPHVRLAGGSLVSGPTVTVTTPRIRGPVTTAVDRDGDILLDGVRFFPVMQWLQCPSNFLANVKLGVNVFLGKGCSDTPDASEVAKLAALGAFSVIPYDASVRASAGLFGWRFDDEPDGNGKGPSVIAGEYRHNRAEDSAHINFLTVESNFDSEMSPPTISNGDRSVYRSYASATDAIGFDLYPIIGWCRPDWIGRVADAQRELVDDYAGGRPTYQWIEAASTSTQSCKGRGPTPAELRAEVWMAVVNGAKAVGYFTHSWTPDYSQFRVGVPVQAEMARTDRELRELTPVLLGRKARLAIAPAAPVDAIARSYRGAVYAFAVNTSRSRQRVTLRLPAAAGARAIVIDEGRSVRVSHGRLTDEFAPLAVHAYELPPPGF